MIKVFFMDNMDKELSVVEFNRESLKNDSSVRRKFRQDVSEEVAHILTKLREEKVREEKCQAQSKR